MIDNGDRVQFVAARQLRTGTVLWRLEDGRVAVHVDGEPEDVRWYVEVDHTAPLEVLQ